MVDRCVCCGAVIPEGTQVCINCRRLYLEPKTKERAASEDFYKSKSAVRPH